jgi:5-methylcytosine-specific restriction endonuclease McrA
VALNGKLGACSPVRRQVWERDRGTCTLCGVTCKRSKKDRYDSDPTLGEIDHIQPVVFGGANTLENLRLLCKSCNRRKAAFEKKRFAGRAA